MTIREHLLNIFRVFGEALIQFFIIGLGILLIEDLGIFMIYITSWTLRSAAEAGILFMIIILITLLITNSLFFFIKFERWFLKALLESLVSIMIFFLILMLFSSLAIYTFTHIMIFVVLTLIANLVTNALFNFILESES